MNFKLICGHSITIAFTANFLTVIHTKDNCKTCLREAIIARNK